MINYLRFEIDFVSNVQYLKISIKLFTCFFCLQTSISSESQLPAEFWLIFFCSKLFFYEQKKTFQKISNDRKLKTIKTSLNFIEKEQSFSSRKDARNTLMIHQRSYTN